MSDRKLKKICKVTTWLAVLYQFYMIFGYIDSGSLVLGKYIVCDVIWLVSAFWLLVFVAVNTGVLKPRNK